MDPPDQCTAQPSLTSPRNAVRRGFIGLLGAAVMGGGTACSELKVGGCSETVETAISQLEPQEADDLSLEGGLTSQGECTHRVFTTRQGDDVATYYRSELLAHGWRVHVTSHEELRGQCTSGFGQCEVLDASRGDVCLALSTDTVRKRQAIGPQRTTVFFYAVNCSDLHPIERAAFPK